MRVVYVLERHYDYEGDTLLSIHATLESAQHAAQQHIDPDERDVEFIQQAPAFWKTWGSPEYHISMHEVEP